MYYISTGPDAREEDLLSASTLRLARSHQLRILIADESRLIAESFMFTLDSDPTLDAIGYSLDGRNALELIASLEPEAVLVGPELGGMSQLKFCELVHQLVPDMLVITLQRRLVPIEVEALYAAGVSACVPLACSADELLHELAAAKERLKRRLASAAEPELAYEGALSA